jgi:hypothetical protein
VILQVRGSPRTSKMAFLERKGLSAGEIEEAFRRVPETEAVPNAPQGSLETPAHASSPTLNTLNQHLHPVAGGPQQRYASQTQVLPPPPPPPHQQLMLSQPQPPPLRWRHIALGTAFAGAGVYAVRSLVWPYVWDAYTSLWGRGRGHGGGDASHDAPAGERSEAAREGAAVDASATSAQAVAEAIKVAEHIRHSCAAAASCQQSSQQALTHRSTCMVLPFQPYQ